MPSTTTTTTTATTTATTTTTPSRRRTTSTHRARRAALSRRAPRTRRCAPGRGGDGVSCFTTRELTGIATLWNQQVAPSDQINLAALRTRAALWNAIDQKMRASSTCTEERCWVSSGTSALRRPVQQHRARTTQRVAGGGGVGRGSCGSGSGGSGGTQAAQQFLSALHHHAFRPRMPATWRQNPNEWLSTSDIENVMRQYQQHDPTFRFVGAVPIDFASPSDVGVMGRCVTQALCNVRLDRWMREGVRRVGIVFNLDTHSEPGSHWVSAYLDLAGNGLYYYDSFGGQAPLEVQQLFVSVGTQLESRHGYPPTIQHNPHRHQFRNTECGIYSIFFLTSMLDATQRRVDGKTAFAQFVGDGLNDGQVERYREVYYDL